MSVDSFLHLDVSTLLGSFPAPSTSVEHSVDSIFRTIIELGLGHLALEREVDSLSLGERRRLTLLASANSPLTGALYVLDEPSSGLHSTDIPRLITFLENLLEKDSTVVVVDHNSSIARIAAKQIHLGPPRRETGGFLLASLGSAEVGLPSTRVRLPLNLGQKIQLSNIRLHNLRDISATIPLGALTCVVGVSGSGKTSLLFGSLLPLVRSLLSKDSNTSSELGSLEILGPAIDRIESFVSG